MTALPSVLNEVANQLQQNGTGNCTQSPASAGIHSSRCQTPSKTTRSDEPPHDSGPVPSQKPTSLSTDPRTLKQPEHRQHATLRPAIKGQSFLLVPITCDHTSCLVSHFDGAFLLHESKDALWARFFTGAPRRLRRSVERYSIVKRA